MTGPRAALLLLAGLLLTEGTEARTLQFAGLAWDVRPNGFGGPGPNQWRDQNVWLDAKGRLHLKISHIGGTWACAQVASVAPMPFGRYRWLVAGRVDQLDRNVVLGLFHYAGPDGQNEIDIELGQWGDPGSDRGHFTVYPPIAGLPYTTRSMPVSLSGSLSTHLYEWSSRSVLFRILDGDQGAELAGWRYLPRDSKTWLPQRPMPLLMNLWLAGGAPPSNGQEVELVIEDFGYEKLP